MFIAVSLCFASLANSPALLAAFIVDRCPGLARTRRRDLCGALRVFLRYCYREGLVEHYLSTSVEMPRTYRLADVPRSITWDEVRRMLACVDRRAVVGRRDFAMLLLLVTYGLRANEVAKLTLDDIDWKRERLSVPLRKAGHWSAYPLAGVVGEPTYETIAQRDPDIAVVIPPRATALPSAEFETNASPRGHAPAHDRLDGSAGLAGGQWIRQARVGGDHDGTLQVHRRDETSCARLARPEDRGSDRGSRFSTACLRVVGRTPSAAHVALLEIVGEGVTSNYAASMHQRPVSCSSASTDPPRSSSTRAGPCPTSSGEVSQPLIAGPTRRWNQPGAGPGQ